MEGGETVYTNPSSSGQYVFTSTLASERDHDGDGISNALDNCPLVANPSQSDGEPNSEPTLPSGDGIGDDCDPTPSTYDDDEDNDGIPNGHDNCPTVANGGQTDSDLDDLGDVPACDPNLSTPNGAYHLLYCSDAVGIGQADPGPASCTSTPPSLTPTATPTLTPTATPTPNPSVGGVAGLPALAPEPAAEGPGSYAPSAIALAAAAAGALLLAAGAWYARRGWRT